MHKNVEPEEYLTAIAELLFSTICISFLITYIFRYELLDDNPIKNMVGYNNPCAFWDQPPALYFASLMFCPMVYFALRYASMDTIRAKLTPRLGGANLCCAINYIYAGSQCLLMGIFVVTPHPAGKYPHEQVQDLHFHMRLHSACFLQFVPVLCVTMTANYLEGYFSENPRSQPSVLAWVVLAFYILATSLETVFATYAIFAYEGNYKKENREQWYVLNPYFMQTVDYCWFLSLPIAAIFQPMAPNLIFQYGLEETYDQVPTDDGEIDETEGDLCCGKCCVAWICVLACLAPLVCIVLAFLPKDLLTLSLSPTMLCAVGLGVSLVACCLLAVPVSESVDPNPFPNGCTGFTINEATFGFTNYVSRLMNFAQAASKSEFRPSYAQWFANNTEDDPEVGVKFGGNTKMFYSWAECREKLSSIGDRIMSGTLKRESELALVVLNNIMWPEAGRFSLGLSNEDHAVVRPFLAAMFDNSQGQPNGWTLDSLREEFASQFANLETIDHDLVTRNVYDLVSPSKSKTIVTQMVLKVLHRVSLGMHITDEEAKELAALQTTQLLPASCPARLVRTLCFWNCVARPARAKEASFIRKYKAMIQKRWPDEPWTDHDQRLSLLASTFLDAMLQAGGRSVPLAIDLVLGYMLSSNRPACLDGVDFTQEANIRSLMMEAMRYHPPVTVLPTWVQGTEQDDPEWKHELICLDRALADPQVFPDPDEFILNRESAEQASMAWGDFALVGGDKAHPHSHVCPGKELSINMVVAFVQAYQASGPWDLANDDIKFNYYGTKGFKLSKSQ